MQIDVGATSAPLAFVVLDDLTSKHSASGFVRVDGGHLELGHGMCSGAFDLATDHHYAASIALVLPERAVRSDAKPATFVYKPITK